MEKMVVVVEGRGGGMGNTHSTSTMNEGRWDGGGNEYKVAGMRDEG